MTPFWRRRRDEDLDEEIRGHLAMAARDRVDRGEPSEAAGLAARREFGNVALTQEITREMWGWTWLERLAQDLRYGARTALRTPGLTIVAILSLALGIGVNSAMFTVVESVLLRPLPYAAPDRLLMVYSVGTFGPITFREGNFTEADYVELQNIDAFSRLAAYAAGQATLSSDGDPVRVSRAAVTASFFPLLGVRPALGRAILASDDATADTRAVVLSDGLWRSRYQGDPRVLGATMTVEGIPHVIVGVMPAAFNFPAKTDIWTPVQIRPTYRSNTTVRLVGRLRDGVSRGQALAIVQTTLTNLARARSTTGGVADRERVNLVDLRESIVGNVRRVLFVLLGAVGCVLLIACTNVANLLMARGASRETEMSIRASLGAGRARLVLQLLTESAALALAGGALGLLVADLSLPIMLAWLPRDLLPRIDEIRVDRIVLMFTSALSLLTGVIFGFAPALVATRDTSIHPSQRVDSGSPRDSRLRSALVVADVSLVLVLLVCAGLLLKSFWKLQHVDPGFRPDAIVTMQVSLPDRVYRTVEQKRRFHEQLLDRIAVVPGATDASAVNFLPFGGFQVNGDFRIPGDQCKPMALVVTKPAISERYFSLLGIPVHLGRAFDARDTDGAPPVAIVSETVARTCWPGENPIGKQLAMDQAADAPWRTVVGVVSDIRQADLRANPAPSIYVPLRQEWRSFFLGSMAFLVRASDAGAVAPSLREAVRALDPSLAVGRVQLLDERLAESIAEPKLRAGVLLAFAALALVLALVGIHGVMSYEVVRRTAEIGIRRALGAPTSVVLRLVIGRTETLVAVGVAIGLTGAVLATRTLRTFLFNVEPLDLATFAAVAAALALVSLVASALPARRAARVDPIVALRCE